MATIDHAAVYDDLLDLLAESAETKRVLAFRLSAAKQDRLDALLDKNRAGTLTAAETAELDAYERFEHAGAAPESSRVAEVGGMTTRPSAELCRAGHRTGEQLL